MPLLFKKEIDDTLFGVWKMLPSEATKRERERENVQWLLNELCGEEKTIAHTPSGKPYLEDHSYHISISHTEGYAAVALHATTEIGIDIEKRADKVKRVRHKYVQEKEEKALNTNQETTHLLLYWCTKESIYKLLDIQSILLKNEVLIHPFIPQEEGWFTAEESKTPSHQHFRIWYKMHEHFALTLALPK